MARRVYVVAFPTRDLSEAEIESVAQFTGMSSFDARQVLSIQGLASPLVQLVDEGRAEAITAQVRSLGIAAAAVPEEALAAARETRITASAFELGRGLVTFSAQGLAPIQVRADEIACIHRGRQDRTYRVGNRPEVKVAQAPAIIGAQMRSASVESEPEAKTIDDQFLAIYRKDGSEPIVLWARLLDRTQSQKSVFAAFDEVVASVSQVLGAPVDSKLMEKRSLPAGVRLLSAGTPLDVSDLGCMMKILLPDLMTAARSAPRAAAPRGASAPRSAAPQGAQQMAATLSSLGPMAEPGSMSPETRRKILVGAAVVVGVGVAAFLVPKLVLDPLSELKSLSISGPKSEVYREALEHYRQVQSNAAGLKLVLHAMKKDLHPDGYSPWTYDPDYELEPGVWAGKPSPEYLEAQYRIDIETVDGNLFSGHILWLAKNKSLGLAGFVEGNHLVFSDFHDLDDGETGWLGPREVFITDSNEMTERNGYDLAHRRR